MIMKSFWILVTFGFIFGGVQSFLISYFVPTPHPKWLSYIGFGNALIFVAIFLIIQPRRKCPRCDTSLPKARFPKSVRQWWHGGWICSKCSCEIDAKGNEIQKPA
jgi:hypothetical protein